MKMYINIIVFAILMAYAMNLGSIVGLIICGIGFLIMMVYIEELEDAEQSLKLHELRKKYLNETNEVDDNTK